MRYECQDCDWGTDEDLSASRLVLGPVDIDQRVMGGEVMPVAECPKCLAVVHDNQCEPIRAMDAIQYLRSWLWQESGAENEVGGADTVDCLSETLIAKGFGPPSHPDNMIDEK